VQDGTPAVPQLSSGSEADAGAVAQLPVGAARLRPSIAAPRALPAVSSLVTARYNSNVPSQDPKSKAQSIIDALPGSSLLSKTAILSSAAGLSIYALSNEYYVMNEETVVAFCLLSVWAALIKYGGPVYREWAEAQNAKIKNILNSARADHTQAVKTRIEDVKQMSGVVDVTKALFEVSKVGRRSWMMTMLSHTHRRERTRRGRFG
jgi:F-type H+-transporting ATPase subunit b